MGRCPLFVFEGTVDRLASARAIAERVARSRGLDIFDVQFRRESVGWVLRVVIDRRWPFDEAATPEAPERAIGIEDCQRFSEEVSTILDVEDVVDHAFTLEVSSPGLDRPLRGVDDFRRFRGRIAKIVVAEPIEDQTHFEGHIEGVDGETILLSVGKKKRVCRIPAPAITRARLEVEF